MEKIKYSKEKMDTVKDKIQQMIDIVSELESDFPGRHFTLDGHLIGSIGEVIAAYYYGIELYKASEKIHDGEVDGKKVQIKITQQDDVLISSEPDYILVLYLGKNGNVYEVYNGTGKTPWKEARSDRRGYRHMRLNKLIDLNSKTTDKLKQINPIEIMTKEFKNIATGKLKSE